MNNMKVIKIEIDNGIYPKIIIQSINPDLFTYISNERKDTKITIHNKSLYSVITSLCIMYRESTNKEYPNK